MRTIEDIVKSAGSTDAYVDAVAIWLLEKESEELSLAIDQALEGFIPFVAVHRMALLRMTPEGLFEGAHYTADKNYHHSFIPPKGMYTPYLKKVTAGEILVSEGNLDRVMTHEEQEYAGLVGAIAHLVVPFKVRGRIWGCISTTRFEGEDTWTTKDIESVSRFGQLLAATYERFAYWTKIQKKNIQLELLSRHLMESQENERRTLSRELHDNFSQQIALLSIKSAMLMQPEQIDNQSEIATQLHTNIQSLSKEMQALSRSLHPAILDDLGLVTALSAECRRIGELKGIDIQTLFDDLPILNQSLSLNLYRILQESLNNISKHAEASAVFILMQVNQNKLVFQISDDGIGCDIESAKVKGSLGLVSMRERTLQFGGDIQFTSEKEGGFTVDITIENINRYYERTA